MTENVQPKDTAKPVARVMIVEDEAIVAKDIETSLTSLGYAICGVMSSGEEAFEAARQSSPDLILMDIMLKGKIDGVEAAKRITESMGIPIVFLTAYSDEGTVNRAKETNVYGYLLKPFEERELHTTIEMALYKSAMERKLRENREWLETTLRCIGDGVLTTNLDSLIEFCNPVAEGLTGWTAREMAMRPLSEVVCLKKNGETIPVEINAELIIQNKFAASAEDDFVLTARDGSQTEVEYSAAPIRHSDGKIMGVVLVLRDVTSRRKALAREQALQRRLARAQRMESVGMMANGVAVQLRRIIGPIIDYPNVILGKLAANGDVNPDLAMIRHSAQKAIDILGNLIAIGQIRDFELEPLSINSVIEEFINTPDFKHKKQNAPLVEFQVELARQNPPLNGNKKHLGELVGGLVAKAYASTHESGLVSVSTEFVKISEPIQGFEIIETGEYVALKISDTGPALDEEKINRFFEPFAAGQNSADTRYEHQLGTALAYAIIKGHKGMIDIKSVAGKGTEVIIYFPVYTGPAKLPDQAEPLDVHGVETILVVDDDPELRKAVAAYLRSIGYKAIAAQNGNEAVDYVKKSVEGEGNAIDLVILDMFMADDFDGLDTYKTILQFNPQQKAILASGFTITDRIKKAMELGAGQCLLKPYDYEELAKAARKELDKPSRET